MKKIMIDKNLIEFNKIENNVFRIWLQYNNLNSQTTFIINLENIHPGITRTFTDRQLKILIKKLRKENDVIW